MIGTSLSEPHASPRARVCVWYVCLDRPLSVNCKWAHSTLFHKDWMSAHVMCDRATARLASEWKKPQGAKMIHVNAFAACTATHFQISLCCESDGYLRPAMSHITSSITHTQLEFPCVPAHSLSGSFNRCVAIVADPAGQMSACVITYTWTLKFAVRQVLIKYSLKLVPGVISLPLSGLLWSEIYSYIVGIALWEWVRSGRGSEWSVVCICKMFEMLFFWLQYICGAAWLQIGKLFLRTRQFLLKM